MFVSRQSNSEGTLILRHEDIAGLVAEMGCHQVMDEMIDRMESAFRHFRNEEWELPAREGFHYQDKGFGLIEWMPVMRRGDRVLLKLVGYHPDNPSQRNLATIQSLLAVFSIRTGAASAIATRLFAPAEACVLGVIGAGAQSITQAHGISRVLSLREILVHDVCDKTEMSFSGRVGAILGDRTPVRVVPKAEVIQRSDVLSVATSVAPGQGPVFDAGLNHQSGLHINAVGSDFEGKVEIPSEWLASAYVSPDFLPQALREGECQQLETNQIGQSLAAFVAAPESAHALRERLTVFDSTGYALEDFVAADWMLEQVEASQVGRRLKFGRTGGDPKNPYADLTKTAKPMPELERLGEEVASVLGSTW